MIARVLAAAAAVASVPIAAPAQTVVSQPNVSTMEARRLVAWGVAEAARRHMRICVAVADADGHLLAFERMQGAYAGCVDASVAKARSAALFAVNTHDFFAMARDQNLALGFIPGILPAVAGVPLRQAGQTVGSVGVSGDKDDTEQALADATAAQFR